MMTKYLYGSTDGTCYWMKLKPFLKQSMMAVLGGVVAITKTKTITTTANPTSNINNNKKKKKNMLNSYKIPLMETHYRTVDQIDSNKIVV